MVDGTLGDFTITSDGHQIGYVNSDKSYRELAERGIKVKNIENSRQARKNSKLKKTKVLQIDWYEQLPEKTRRKIKRFTGD